MKLTIKQVLCFERCQKMKAELPLKIKLNAMVRVQRHEKQCPRNNLYQNKKSKGKDDYLFPFLDIYDGWASYNVKYVRSHAHGMKQNSYYKAYLARYGDN